MGLVLVESSVDLFLKGVDCGWQKSGKLEFISLFCGEARAFVEVWCPEESMAG